MRTINTVSVPAAYVTKSKQRVKQYDNTIYLENGDEFEIELFNPTGNKVLAKIEINGKNIGGTGIVLRPGERVYLERYLNESKKFLFETYKVSGEDSQVKQAIKNNGDVVVKFYQEYIAQPIVSSNYWYNTYNGTGDFVFPTTFTTSGIGSINVTTDGFLGAGSMNISSIGTTTNTVNSNLSNSNVGGVLRSRSTSRVGTQYDNSERKIKSLSKQSFETPKEIETGRVEKGSNSDQKFGIDYSTFNSYSSWVSNWKLLPMSQKETVIEDIKVFCTECGAKRKKDSHKFCPTCGTKF